MFLLPQTIEARINHFRQTLETVNLSSSSPSSFVKVPCSLTEIDASVAPGEESSSLEAWLEYCYEQVENVEQTRRLFFQSVHQEHLDGKRKRKYPEQDSPPNQEIYNDEQETIPIPLPRQIYNQLQEKNIICIKIWEQIMKNIILEVKSM